MCEYNFDKTLFFNQIVKKNVIEGWQKFGKSIIDIELEHSILEYLIENKNIELRNKGKMGRPKKFKAVDLKTTKLYDEVTKIQADILSKLMALKKERPRNSSQCEHLVQSEEVPPYNHSQDYYDTFWKTYLLNEIKREKVVGLNKEIKELNESISFIDRKFQKYEKLVSYRKNYIMKSNCDRFICDFEGCQKAYDSQGALQLHQKLKHESAKDRDEKNFNPSVFFQDPQNEAESEDRYPM